MTVCAHQLALGDFFEDYAPTAMSTNDQRADIADLRGRPVGGPTPSLQEGRLVRNRRTVAPTLDRGTRTEVPRVASSSAPGESVAFGGGSRGRNPSCTPCTRLDDHHGASDESR